MHKKLIIFIFIFLFSFNFVLANESSYRADDYCYYNNELIPFCKAKNFEILGDEYAKDNIRVYHRGERLDGADVSTFMHVGGAYARDRQQVYLNGKVLPGADSASIEYIDMDYAQDNDNLYYKYDVLSGFDPVSFKIINADYVLDKNFVYYKHEKIDDSHPLTFSLLADDYAKDLNYYYRYGKAVAKAENDFYNRYQTKDLSGTCTNELLAQSALDELESLGGDLSKDNICVYFGADIIENSHAKSFEFISDNVFKDKNFVYFLEDTIDDTIVSSILYAHAKSFVKLDGAYYSDKYAVYYGDKLEIINGADPKTFKVICMGENCTYEAEDKYRLYLSGIETALDEATKQLIGESKLVYASPIALDFLLIYNKVARDLDKESEAVGKYLEELLLGVYGFDKESKQAILNFIVYGTETTRILGAGERSGVVNSYRSAFGKLPRSEQDWADVIKIANGRWPTERNEIAEERAEGRFRYIYQRTPLSWDEHDQSAITVIAYGLRTRTRNVNSEKSAILTFKRLFMDYPSSASDWDMVRAIAYSGASR
ncbi:MAG: DKNYY domain-containing protein [Patescibacteria group bacterium]|nr:DKNYY domain-containing protein [Patescibacteria group bacterium]